MTASILGLWLVAGGLINLIGRKWTLRHWETIRARDGDSLSLRLFLWEARNRSRISAVSIVAGVVMFIVAHVTT